MRIGIDARMYGSGFTGIGRYTYELIHNLAQLDRSNDYVIFLRKEAFDGFVPPSPRFQKVLADFPHYSLAEQTRFLSVLNREHLDLMHFCHFNAPVLYRHPFVVTLHDLTLSFFPGKKMTHWIQRVAYHIVLRLVTRHAQQIIAVSGHTKKDLQTLLGIPDEKVTVIFNGVNPDFSTPSSVDPKALRTQFGLAKPYFLYTGVWRDHKNIVGLLKAFDALNRESDHHYQLVITGRPNPNYPEIPETVKALRLENEVRLTGLVGDEELKALYQQALAYVFPSFYEGFGFPPLEAMLCGIPVAASNTSSIPEICGQGNAVFFDPYDIEAMTTAMRTVATDQALRKDLVERGFKHALRFKWEAMASSVLDVYNGILKGI
ncbi:glycosyltransferase family 4 protein [Candidatus Peregrinibacteria bacterium]|nr:glycosyltransferase family 4 protein [Candidatus Peregrinibacteria bacterium]